ncbi:hypothetical protein F5144DRAFT_142195 [Chaetomium tenue]|uniref:Uncharacterized protein n=1 Tax=Chaetomium tenue TaxID=1854479 RepID=A0ACB7PKY1_9PEZI|nr:hypothetical protein F5144DRAFT_142195 [Chaetomium globosum]
MYQSRRRCLALSASSQPRGRSLTTRGVVSESAGSVPKRLLFARGFPCVCVSLVFVPFVMEVCLSQPIDYGTAPQTNVMRRALLGRLSVGRFTAGSRFASAGLCSLALSQQVDWRGESNSSWAKVAVSGCRFSNQESTARWTASRDPEGPGE